MPTIVPPSSDSPQQARREGFPYRIALRDDDRGELDDVVVTDVSMFRAEMMDNKTLWMCCYFPDSDQRIAFWVRSKRGPLEFCVTEEPDEDEAFAYEPAPAVVERGE